MCWSIHLSPLFPLELLGHLGRFGRGLGLGAGDHVPDEVLVGGVDVGPILGGALGRVVPRRKRLDVTLELCLRLEVLLAVVVLRALVLVLVGTVVHPLVHQAVLLVVPLHVLVQNVLRRVAFATDFTEPTVGLLWLVIAGHVKGQRLRVGKLLAAKIAKLMGVKDPDVRGQGLVGPADPLAALLRAGDEVLSVRSLVEDPDGGVRELLSALFAGQLVRLDVVLVLVFLGEQVLVELELLAAVLADRHLQKWDASIAPILSIIINQ